MGIFGGSGRQNGDEGHHSNAMPRSPVNHGHGHNNNNGIFQGSAESYETKNSTHVRPNDEDIDEHDGIYLSYMKAPSIGRWFKLKWIDLVLLVAAGGLALGLYYIKPTHTRQFPLNFQDGEVIYPQFAYPHRRNIFPLWAVALLSTLGPITIMLVMSFITNSFWDANNAVFGLLYSVVGAALIQVILKILIGGFAPNFLEVCKPVLRQGVVLGQGYRQLFYNSGDVCTGDPMAIARAMESFPCGKSTTAFAGLMYLFLYLNAKLKLWANYNPSFWKLVLTYTPLVGAVLIAGTNSIDRHHHWYDCLAGAIIGTLLAFSAYRMVYASIWDFRFNHIPLHKKAPFSYGGPSMELTRSVVATAGAWRTGYGVWGGAPGDSTKGQPIINMSKPSRPLHHDVEMHPTAREDPGLAPRGSPAPAHAGLHPTQPRATVTEIHDGLEPAPVAATRA